MNRTMESLDEPRSDAGVNEMPPNASEQNSNCNFSTPHGMHLRAHMHLGASEQSCSSLGGLNTRLQTLRSRILAEESLSQEYRDAANELRYALEEHRQKIFSLRNYITEQEQETRRFRAEMSETVAEKAKYDARIHSYDTKREVWQQGALLAHTKFDATSWKLLRTKLETAMAFRKMTMTTLRHTSLVATEDETHNALEHEVLLKQLNGSSMRLRPDSEMYEDTMKQAKQLGISESKCWKLMAEGSQAVFEHAPRGQVAASTSPDQSPLPPLRILSRVHGHTATQDESQIGGETTRAMLAALQSLRSNEQPAAVPRTDERDVYLRFNSDITDEVLKEVAMRQKMPSVMRSFLEECRRGNFDASPKFCKPCRLIALLYFGRQQVQFEPTQDELRHNEIADAKELSPRQKTERVMRIFRSVNSVLAASNSSHCPFLCICRSYKMPPSHCCKINTRTDWIRSLS
ncbi:MAG: hypothetical protein MHM6MM_000165 [Cercozoa sp. M6MM]